MKTIIILLILIIIKNANAANHFQANGKNLKNNTIEKLPFKINFNKNNIRESFWGEGWCSEIDIKLIIRNSEEVFVKSCFSPIKLFSKSSTHFLSDDKSISLKKLENRWIYQYRNKNLYIFNPNGDLILFNKRNTTLEIKITKNEIFIQGLNVPFKNEYRIDSERISFNGRFLLRKSYEE